MAGFYVPYGKRMLDITGVAVLALLFGWLFILIVMVYLVTFQWPVFYHSLRIGKGGDHFLMYKFRTLSVNAERSLEQRRFWLGNLLRTTNLDELPQLWNVVKGKMSLVGPRPLPVTYADLFTLEQSNRHSVLPGITGLAQVNGKNSLPWKKKFEYDLKYVREISFRLDLRIIVKTVLLMIRMKKDISLTERPLG
jgi:undecaprenyl phosphate N,N'-diacetylbacillosamine 1-phosphate transferase